MLAESSHWTSSAKARAAESESAAKLASEAIRRGEDLRRVWKLDSAESAFREAAALVPANPDAALGLARISRLKLEYAQAKTFVDKANRERRMSLEVLDEYGAIYLAAEDAGQARRYFESALSQRPSDVAAIIGLAGVDLLDRNYDRAAKSLRDCLARGPQDGKEHDSRVHAMLARVLLESNRLAEAGEHAALAIAADSYNVDALYVLACVRSSERKPEEAKSLARRAVSLDSFNFGARRVLSQYVDSQTGAQQRVSEQARAYYSAGRRLKQAGEFTKAIEDLESALRIEPRYYAALIGLADIWLRQGDSARAAVAARLATEVDPDGALAHLELSCAHRGIYERARIEIGAVDFAALFYAQPTPQAYSLTREIFPQYSLLTRRQQIVIDAAVAPLAGFLPKLASRKARHYLLAYDQHPGDLRGFADVADEKTFDGRYYASLRGVGGRVTASGIEYLNQAAHGGFNTIAHEFAHQVHIAALDKNNFREIHRLFERARRENLMLDFYAAANEYEYFAQGYEAFIAERKRPSAGVTGRHVRQELAAIDPELYKFLLKLTANNPSIKAVGSVKQQSNTGCLTRNNRACEYAGGAFPVSGGQQLRLPHTHPRVALNSAQHNGICEDSFSRLLGVKHFRRSIV